MTSTFGGRKGYIASIDPLCVVLDKERLRDYWDTHRDALVQVAKATSKVVRTANYFANYADDFPAWAAELDKLSAG